MPPALPSKPASSSTRIVVAVTALAVAALAGAALLGVGGLEVSLTNKTGKPLTDVSLGGTSFAGVADGETVRASLPLADKVTVRLKGGDGRPVETAYPYQNRSGFKHTLGITLDPALPQKGDSPQAGRSWVSSSQALVGYEVQYHEPIDQLEPVPLTR